MSRRQKKNKNRLILRRGIVLYIVIIVLAVLSLGGITLLALMQTEYEATIVRTQELQLSNVNRSAVVLMESVLELTPQERSQFGGLYNNPTLFCNVPVLPQAAGGKGNAHFTILSPMFDDEKITGVRYGLVNESSRLNLAALLQWDADNPGTGRRSLMKLPGMTSTMADSILDWIDSDEQARPRGAEASFYSKKAVPYSPRNALPVFLEELLLVRDVTRLQLYGTDEAFNYNNVASKNIDSNSTATDATSLYFNALESNDSVSDDLQNASSGSVSTDQGTNNISNSLSADAIPNETISESPNVYNVGEVPWIQYLTVFSAEKDVDPSGESRIDLNGSDLSFLYDELSQYVDEKTAEFVVLFRQFGPATSEQIKTATPVKDNSGTESSILDFSIPAKFRLNTPLDIIGTTVIVPAKNASTPAVQTASNVDAARIVESPFPAKRSIADDLFNYLDFVSTSSSTIILGRININEASRTVLETIPDLTAGDVQKIISMRPSYQEKDKAKYRHSAWLYTEGAVNLAKMKKIWSKTTTGGDVYRGQIISFMEDRGANRRGEVVVDNTVSPPRQVFYKDLTMYGQGYSSDVLTGQSNNNVATNELVRLMQESSSSSSDFPDVDFAASSLDPMEIIKQNEIPSNETTNTTSQKLNEPTKPSDSAADSAKPLNKRQELLQKLKELRQPISTTSNSSANSTATSELDQSKETTNSVSNSSASPTTTTANVPSTSDFPNSANSSPSSQQNGKNSQITEPSGQEIPAPNRRQQLLQTLREQRQRSDNSKQE